MPIGDVYGAVSYLVDHSEQMGDVVLRWLAQEERFESTRRITQQARRIHREWVKRTFASSPAAAARRVSAAWPN